VDRNTGRLIIKALTERVFKYKPGVNQVVLVHNSGSGGVTGEYMPQSIDELIARIKELQEEFGFII
jgi:hypothetical protein